MRDPMDLERLYMDESFASIVTRKDLREIILERTDKWGRTVITTNGTVRSLKFKSLGGGLYRLYTTKLDPK